MKTFYCIDLPNINVDYDTDNSWVLAVEKFDTRQEAMDYLESTYGITKEHASIFISKVKL